MWVKTVDGSLVNLSKAYSIYVKVEKKKVRVVVETPNSWEDIWEMTFWKSMCNQEEAKLHAQKFINKLLKKTGSGNE